MSEGGEGARRFSATQFQLKRKFKHAVDFGVRGPFNRMNLALFEQALATHVADPESHPVVIRYARGAGIGGFEAICHINERTRLAVITTMGGRFVTGYELSSNQVDNVVQRGKLGGG